eukprot:Pgem_evm2s17888
MVKKLENLNGKLSIEMTKDDTEEIEGILFFDIFNKKKFCYECKRVHSMYDTKNCIKEFNNEEQENNDDCIEQNHKESEWRQAKATYKVNNQGVGLNNHIRLQVEERENSNQSDMLPEFPSFSYKRSKQMASPTNSPEIKQQLKKVLDEVENGELCKAILQANVERKELESKEINGKKNDEENKNGKLSMSLSVVDNNDSEKAKSISTPVNADDLIAKSDSNYAFCIKDQLNKKNGSNVNNYGCLNEDTS